MRGFLEWPDQLQVWPAHGAGSACGKALGAVPMSTVGYEKMFNASVKAAASEQGFVNFLVSCRSGARSARACSLLQRHGYDVTSLAGGMLAWDEARNGSTRNPKPSARLSRIVSRSASAKPAARALGVAAKRSLRCRRSTT